MLQNFMYFPSHFVFAQIHLYFKIHELNDDVFGLKSMGRVDYQHWPPLHWNLVISLLLHTKLRPFLNLH